MIVSLITRDYLNGRLAITTDRLGGFRAGNGNKSETFWSNLIIWAGKKEPGETVRVGVVKSEETHYETFLSSLERITYEEINEEYLAKNGSEEFDVLYFISLKKQNTPDILPNVLEEYVRNGGGLIIESPDIEGEIGIISEIDSVSVRSVTRPSYDSAFWSNKGFNSPIYSADNYAASFMVEIREEDFSVDWDILLSDVEVTREVFDNEGTVDSYEYSERSFQEFSIGFAIVTKNGAVFLDED